MQIQITGHQVDITDAIKDFINSKFLRLEKHFDQITHSHVILTTEKTEHVAEAKLDLAGSTVFAKSSQSDMYAAIDVLLDKLDRQIIKHKEKHSNHHAKRPQFDAAEDGEV